jgi:hypothetical protein
LGEGTGTVICGITCAGGIVELRNENYKLNKQ